MIYMTPFDPATKECTGGSEDSGFQTIADAVAVMGDPIRRGLSLAIYPGVVFSRVMFSIDAPVIPAVSSASDTTTGGT